MQLSFLLFCRYRLRFFFLSMHTMFIYLFFDNFIHTNIHIYLDPDPNPPTYPQQTSTYPPLTFTSSFFFETHGVQLLMPDEMLTGLVGWSMCRSCVGIHSCSELMRTMAMSCLEGSSSRLSSPFAWYFLSFAWGFDRAVPFKAEHATVTCTQHSD